MKFPKIIQKRNKNILAHKTRRRFEESNLKEYKGLLKLSKKLLTKKELLKIEKICDLNEKNQTLRTLIVWDLDKKLYEINKIILDKKSKGFDVLYAEIKYIKLKGKIKFFITHFDKEEFNKVNSLFSEIKKEFKLMEKNV